MNKKRLFLLFLSINIITAGVFLIAAIKLDQINHVNVGADQNWMVAREITKDKSASDPEPTKSSGSNIDRQKETANSDSLDRRESTEEDSLAASTDSNTLPKLIYDSSSIDYNSFIPKMKYDSKLENALDITNPVLDIDAKEAILFDAKTKRVLFYKNAVQAAFPASTLKLLTSLVALKWCTVQERVTVGDEITMIAPDSTKAYLKEGQVITVKNLLEAMLLPSGNDAAYVTATYVGRKSLNNPDAPKEKAVAEFVRLMNNQAKELGVKNSCFKTPDGYDAIGQYTTAYDMGMIGMAAAENDTITEITGLSSVRATLISGEDITWDSTNRLITRYSGDYFSPAIGLKTGTSTMAGRCIIAAAKQNEKKVICVVLNSSITGRWGDAVTLLKYGLNNVK